MKREPKQKKLKKHYRRTCGAVAVEEGLMQEGRILVSVVKMRVRQDMEDMIQILMILIKVI